MQKLFSLLFALSVTTAAFAHEGHGHSDGYTIKHYFTAPEHVIPVVVAVALAILLVARYRKTTAKK